MKKFIPLFISAGLTILYGCGQSKKEIAKQEKTKLDSMRMADSLASIIKKAKFLEDSLDNAQTVEKEKVHLDSIDMAKSKHHGTKKRNK